LEPRVFEASLGNIEDPDLKKITKKKKKTKKQKTGLLKLGTNGSCL
jgi:hypothetical protein